MERIDVVDLACAAEPLGQAALLLLCKLDAVQFQNGEESFFLDEARFLCRFQSRRYNWQVIDLPRSMFLMSVRSCAFV